MNNNFFQGKRGGAGQGRGRGAGQGRGRGSGDKPGSGPSGTCICPKCGTKMTRA